jgi:hypothetical protein
MPPETKSVTPAVFYRTLSVQGLEIFYREAGPRDAPTVSLLHGFRSSSHMFRNLIPVAVLAVALAEFGVLETVRIAQQAQHRLRFLDEIDTLITNPDTKEAAVHTALATNLWVFGVEFALVVSNTTLANTLKKYTDEKFTGPRAQYPTRPVVAHPTRATLQARGVQTPQPHLRPPGCQPGRAVPR